MNYIKEAEKYLEHYETLEKSIDSMQGEIARLISKSMPKGLASPKLDITGVSGGTEQDEFYNTVFKIHKLIKSKKETEEELKKIDTILEEISRGRGRKYYGPVLRKWYIEGVPKENIADEIGYSSRQSIYSLKAKAIRKFAVRLFGIEALRIF